MKIPYYFLVLLLMLAGFGRANAQVEVQATVDAATLKIGEQTQLHFVVHQPVGAKVNFPQLVDTISANIVIVKAGKLDTAADSKDPKRIAVHQAYTITVFEEGKYTIPAYEFGSSTGPVTTTPIPLDIRTVRVDTTKAIYDIKEPLAVSYSFWDWLRDNWLLVQAILFGLVLIIGFILYLKNRQKKLVKIVKKAEPVVPLHISTVAKLNELRERKLWQQGDDKTYHVTLSDIMRDYLEARYLIKTHEKTTAEIFASLKFLDIAEGDRNMLRLILLLADMVKFAKEKPSPAENELSLDNAISFVNNTKQEVAPPASSTEGGAANV